MDGVDMPRKYGSYKTVWEPHKKLSAEDVWKNVMNSLISHGYNFGLIIFKASSDPVFHCLKKALAVE